MLYTTDLYPIMHHQPVVHLLVHLHLLISGYLFTIAMVSVDPLPHHRGYRQRSIVLIFALAGHGILAKYLFAHPPAGVAGSVAETGSVLMYYGGDAVEVTIMIILGWRWYRSARPRQALGAETRSAVSPLGEV